MPYLALYLATRGFSGRQIGLLLAVIPLVGFLAQPLWGVASDVYHLRKKGLALACFSAAFLTLLLDVATSYGLLLLLIALYAAMNGAIGPLGTTLALDYLEDDPGQKQSRFGSLRLWGSIGFALGSFAIGAWIIEGAPARIVPLNSAAIFLLGLVVVTLPDAPGHETNNWREGLVLLQRDQTLAAFLAGALLVGMTFGIVNNYLAVYLDEIQAAGWVIGAAMAISGLAEVPLMANVPAYLHRWGLHLTLVGGTLLLPLRSLLYVFITDPLWVLPTQILHSIAMTSLLVVGVLYVDRRLSRRWRASGQSLYTAALFGLGPSLGLYMAGHIHEAMGIRSVWLMGFVVSLIGTFILHLSVRRGEPAHPQPEATR